MSRYQLTPHAVEDLFDIWTFIAQDNPQAADRVEEEIFRACDLLGRSPYAGQIRENLTSLPVRFWVVSRYPSYLIVYDPEKEPVQILRVIHAARNLPSVLK